MRLIPSLSGGLYTFDGQNLETLPISVDQLLNSSFERTDNLVFSGSSEVQSYRKFCYLNKFFMMNISSTYMANIKRSF